MIIAHPFYSYFRITVVIARMLKLPVIMSPQKCKKLIVVVLKT